MSTICESVHVRPQALSSSALRYRLVKGSVSLAPMIVLGSRVIFWDDWCVSFFVLGASHAMQLTQGRRKVTEILSCMEPPVDCRVLAALGLTGVGCTTTEVHGLSMRVQLKSLDLPDVAPHISGVNPDHNTNCLTHAYPNPDLNVPSWTRLRWQVTKEALHLETEHTYPHEGVSIHSETTISVISR